MPLFDSALGTTITSARYQEHAGVSPHIASRDLRILADTGILDARGETKARRYLAGKELLEARRKVRISRPLRDPYEVVREQEIAAGQRALPL